MLVDQGQQLFELHSLMRKYGYIWKSK